MTIKTSFSANVNCHDSKMPERPSQGEKDPQSFEFQRAAHKVLDFEVFFRIGNFFCIQLVQLVKSQKRRFQP